MTSFYVLSMTVLACCLGEYICWFNYNLSMLQGG